MEKRCRTCDFRHGLCNSYPPPKTGDCSHWRLGQCYTCKYFGAPGEEWFKRGCESEYPSGCKKYKRNWKAWFKYKLRKLGVSQL